MQRPLELQVKVPRRLFIESGSIINRGLKDLAPKYLDIAKLSKTLLRQISDNSVDDISSVHLFMPFSGTEAERLAVTFQDTLNFTINAPLIGTLTERLYSASGKSAFIIASNAEAISQDYLLDFAKALNAHDRNLELGLAKDLISRARERDALAGKERRAEQEVVIIEERGGKFGPLILEEPTIRLHLKKWQSIISNRDAKLELRPPIETIGGFGAGAAMVVDMGMNPDSSHPKGFFFTVASAKLGDMLSVELVAQIKASIITWLKDLNIPYESLKRVYISTPFMSISSFIGQAFSGFSTTSPLLMYPDHIYGWQPLLTLLAMLRQPLHPSLFIYLGTGYTIHTAVIWAPV